MDSLLLYSAPLAATGYRTKQRKEEEVQQASVDKRGNSVMLHWLHIADDSSGHSFPPLRSIVTKHMAEDQGEGWYFMTLFTKGVWFTLEALSKSECDMVSLDWTIRTAFANGVTQELVTLQGNVDSNAFAWRQWCYCCRDRGDSGRVLYRGQRGHGISQTVPFDAVEVFLQTM
ncbi:hypothetical protein B0O80DRAFT_49942 [Mortierella sp. GBAus27b]|nr:hypothetical protein B0O80DRAFT_49942 [Mortierella sp. GBAus27b]